jgi:DNA polymerase III sliding clamp (beta) subunit (PCNA family)
VLKPTEFAATATIAISDLTSMLRRAVSIADDEHAQICIEVDGDTLNLATTHSASGSISDNIPAKHQGGSRRVALSARRMIAALAAVGHAESTLTFRKKLPLITIHPGEIGVGEGEQDLLGCDNLVMLIGIGSR